MSKILKKLSQTPYKLPLQLDQAIHSMVKSIPYKQLANEIMRISTLFQSSESVTPWDSRLSQSAYLAYFFPLNYLRNRAVIDRLKPLVDFSQFKSVLDVGSGCGTTHFVFNDISSFDFIENSKPAIQLHQQLLQQLNIKTKNNWSSDFTGHKKNQLTVLSYSLNEFSKTPSWLFDCNDLLIIEPSTHQAGRKLLELRKAALQAGLHAWAPCLHQKACPVLSQSKKDWCHDRIFIEMPDWWLKLEDRLPMKNKSITFSYLYLSQTASRTFEQQVRLIGDTLVQKGKTRQMACRGENREFLSWMHRLKLNDTYPRGERVYIPESSVTHNSEIKITEDKLTLIDC